MKTAIIQKSIVLNNQAKILLLRRSETDTRRPRQWDFPGGILDNGETLEEGVKRELTEESGITISDLRLIFAKAEVASWTDETGGHEVNTIRLYYSARTESAEIVLSKEHSEFQWVALEEALRMLEYPRHREVIQYIIDNKLEL